MTKFKDLNLNSTYLFAAVFGDEDACRLLLEIILGREIKELCVTTEKNLLLSNEVKWIRLDVHATGKLNVSYDIEAQNYKEGSIAKRSRYYQAEMDVATMKPGDPFDMLGDSFVIFICTYDPFGEGLIKYTFEERCLENGQPLGDGTTKIFFNTKGIYGEDVSEELRHFLGYFETTTDEYVTGTDYERVHKIHQKVTQIKQSREWEAGYMKFEELLAREHREGELEGKIEGKLEWIFEVLKKFDHVPEDITASIKSIDDIDKLDKLFQLALKAEVLDDFVVEATKVIS